MRMRRMIVLAGAFLFAVWALAPIDGSRMEAVGAGQGRGGGGRADAPTIGPGNLVTGVWGENATAVDSRGWGWMTKSYVSGGFKRPFYNKAKEMLFSDKQVTSFTISRFDPEFYCEVRKHYGFVWFEMQHSTMSW